MKVLMKRLHPNAKVPTQGSPLSAGYDVYACMDDSLMIFPHCTEKVGIGWAMKPENEEAFYITVNARSGLATKEGLRPANCVGICDADYRGEYMVALHNDSNEVRFVQPNDKIAQILLVPRYIMDFEEVEELDETERGSGGFGHTGN